MADPAWETQLPFPVMRESREIGWSRYSIIARIQLGVVLLVMILALVLAVYG